MDTAKLDQGRMITAAGGVILIVAIFLTWVAGRSAWDVFNAVHIVMLLIGIGAILSAVLPSTGAAVTLPARLSLLVSALGLAAFGFAAGWELEISGGIGVWLAIIGSLAIAFGAYESAGEPHAHHSAGPDPAGPEPVSARSRPQA